jgi:hypothetical protein
MPAPIGVIEGLSAHPLRRRPPTGGSLGACWARGRQPPQDRRPPGSSVSAASFILPLMWMLRSDHDAKRVPPALGPGVRGAASRGGSRRARVRAILDDEVSVRLLESWGRRSASPVDRAAPLPPHLNELMAFVDTCRRAAPCCITARSSLLLRGPTRAIAPQGRRPLRHHRRGHPRALPDRSRGRLHHEAVSEPQRFRERRPPILRPGAYPVLA